MQTTTRNATLEDLAQMLQEQHARKIDVVTGARGIRAENSVLRITGTQPILEQDGVTLGDGLYVPTSVCDGGIAEKLRIPTAYLRRLREERPDLYDANVNGWLHGTGSPSQGAYIHADSRSFLVRCFRGDGDDPGIARAFLSDRYRVVDNLDVLLSALEGVNDAGVGVNIDGCDLTERRMYVRVIAPEVQVQAERLLRDYRNPFGDDFERWRRLADREGLGFGGAEPVIFAGFVITNSEVGDGAWTITPRVVIRVCKNGLTITQDAMREVHLGGQMEEGVIDWSQDTREKAVDLVRSKARDAVSTFLSEEYLTRTVERLEEKGTQPIESPEQVQVLTKSLRFSKDHADGILNRFVRGGQMTRMGVVNAITAHAQTLDDGDEAHTLEEQAVSLLA